MGRGEHRRLRYYHQQGTEVKPHGFPARLVVVGQARRKASLLCQRCHDRVSAVTTWSEPLWKLGQPLVCRCCIKQWLATIVMLQYMSMQFKHTIGAAATYCPYDHSRHPWAVLQIAGKVVLKFKIIARALRINFVQRTESVFTPVSIVNANLLHTQTHGLLVFITHLGSMSKNE